MKTKVLGVLLVVLGAAALWFGGIPYTDREQILDIGVVQASAEVRERIDVPPIVAGAVLALGVGLLVHGAHRRT